MNDTVKYVLEESRMPKVWYNLQADLPQGAAPGAAPRHPASPSGRTIWRRSSRWS